MNYQGMYNYDDNFHAPMILQMYFIDAERPHESSAGKGKGKGKSSKGALRHHWRWDLWWIYRTSYPLVMSK